MGDNKDVVPYLGGLYSLNYRELEAASPEFWKIRLQATVQAILAALGKRAPTVFFLEDLHWADPSFVELLRRACLEMRQPAVVLCVYRPTFTLFNSHQLSSLGNVYHEIRLKDLSLSDAQHMLESLLKTDGIPSDLKQLVQSKAEGNPFYLEELVNTLIDSATGNSREPLLNLIYPPRCMALFPAGLIGWRLRPDAFCKRPRSSAGLFFSKSS
jgi:predicted ATPase